MRRELQHRQGANHYFDSQRLMILKGKPSSFWSWCIKGNESISSFASTIVANSKFMSFICFFSYKTFHVIILHLFTALKTRLCSLHPIFFSSWCGQQSAPSVHRNSGHVLQLILVGWQSNGWTILKVAEVLCLSLGVSSCSLLCSASMLVMLGGGKAASSGATLCQSV